MYRVLIRLALAAGLLLAACTPQVARDALSGADARCAEAQSLYDGAPSATAAALTVAACIR